MSTPTLSAPTLFDDTSDKKHVDERVVDWDSPTAHARARIAMCGDECVADINRVVRAVHRDYQLSRDDWSDVLSELHGQVARLTGLVAKFIEEGSGSEQT